MIDNGTFRLAFFAVLITAFAVLLVYLTYLPWKKYKQAERLAGEWLMELEPAVKTRWYRRIEILLAVLVSIYLVLLDFQRDIHNLSTFAVILGALISTRLSLKPQIICENGILVSYGLVLWEDIASIQSVDATDTKMELKLRKRVGNSKKLIVYCKSEEIMNVMYLIQRKMERSMSDASYLT